MVNSHYHETCANTHFISGEMYYAVAFCIKMAWEAWLGMLCMSLEFISEHLKSHKILKSVLYLKFFLSSAFVFSEAKHNLF